MVTLPWQDSADFIEEITLDNVPYNFRFTFNSRGEFWTMDIDSRDQVEIISGVRLALDQELLRQHPGRSLPPGMMFPIDDTGNKNPIEQGDFLNGRVKLVYATEAEVEAV